MLLSILIESYKINQFPNRFYLYVGLHAAIVLPSGYRFTTNDSLQWIISDINRKYLFVGLWILI